MDGVLDAGRLGSPSFLSASRTARLRSRSHWDPLCTEDLSMTKELKGGSFFEQSLLSKNTTQ